MTSKPLTRYLVSEDPASVPSIVDDSASDDENIDAPSISSVKGAVEKTTDLKRNLISKLKGKKNSKQTKEVTTENRIIALEQEELQLRKRMINHLEKSEKNVHRKYAKLRYKFKFSQFNSAEFEWLQHTRDDDATES